MFVMLTLSADCSLQVMYMYYLLGYRLLGQQEDIQSQSTLERDDKWRNSSGHFVKGNLFKYIPERVLVQVTSHSRHTHVTLSLTSTSHSP